MKDKFSSIKVNNKKIINLDSNWTDFELLDYWNNFFSDYGFHITDLNDSWEKLYLKDEFGENDTSVNDDIDTLKLGKFLPTKKFVDGMG